MNRGQAPDPNSLGELEKQAGNARTLQYLGIDAETAQKIAALPEGQRIKALGSEWDNRTDEQKQAGVELAKQDADTANKVISDPAAPKVEQTPDGKYVVTTKQGEETHSVPFETEEGAKAGLQMSLEDHLNKIQNENLSWEEQMHRAEAVAKLHLMEGTEENPPLIQKSNQATPEEKNSGVSPKEIYTFKDATGADPELDERVSEISKTLAREPFYNGQDPGLKVVTQDGSSSSSRGASRFLQTFQDLVGKRVVWVASKDGSQLDAGAFIDKSKPNTIYLSAHSDTPIHALVGEEWLHSVEKQDPEAYKDLIAKLKPHILDWKGNVEKMADLGYRPEMHEEEFVGKLVADAFTRPDFWRIVEAKDKPLFQKIVDSVNKWFEELKGKLVKTHWGTEEAISNLESVHKAIADTLQGAAKNQYGELDFGESPDIAKSLNKSRDEAYDAAVKSGDEAEQQRLVDEAAKEAGYTIGPVYHGGDHFNEFDWNKLGQNGTSEGKGFYFTNKESVAKGYADGKRVIKSYLKGGDRIDGNKVTVSVATLKKFLTDLHKTSEATEEYSSPLYNYGDIDHEGLSKVVSQAANLLHDSNSDVEILSGMINGGSDPELTFRTWQKVTGQTGIMEKGKWGGDDHEIHVVTDAAHTKDASPITRDDAGNIIPLSERFNPQSNDIRFSKEKDQQAKGEKFASAHSGEEIPADAIKDQPSRDRIQAELEKRMASGPDVKTRIFENAAKRFEAITKRQNAVMEAFAKGDASSSDVIKKDMERNLVEVNAILSALPPDIRASLTRNWRNPETGEGGNIYTKYASLGNEKAKADFLIKQIDKASDFIDHALSSEYLERGYKLLEAAQPFNERGKGLQGKIGPEGHETINKITDLWHMDEGQVADYIQSRQKQLADPEISDEKRDELEQEIHLANIHGNFSPVDAKGTYKHLGDEMPADARAQALESLKQIIEIGRLDWKAEKDANKAKWEANRSEVKEAILGEDREATSAEIAKSREGASMMLSGVSNFFDSHLSHLARFTQILGDAAKPWVRRILDATNQKADLDQKLDHESHSAMIKALFGDKAEDNLANRTRFKMVLSDLSMPKETGAISIENRQYKKTKFNKTVAESFIKDPTTWMGTDTELNYLSRALSDLTPKSRVKGFDVYYPKEGTGEEVNLHLSEMEAIQRLLSWRQPDARLKMERNGMSQETADKLEEFVNKTKEGAAFYNYLKGAYDHYEKINAVYRKMFGVDMPRVKNYAPTAYDTAKGTEDPVSLDEYGGGASSMAGFTKTRQSHIAKVKDSNAWVTYQAHMDAVNYWLSNAELVRDLRATFGNTDVLRAAEVKSVADRKYLTDFIKYLSRDNSTTQALTGWNSKFARAASNILSNSALAFNIPVTLKHIIPAVSSAMKMDAGQFVTSALRVATGQAERPAIFGENNLYSSPEVMRFANAAHSGSDSDAVQAAKESKGLGRKTKLGLEATGKWGHSWITSLVHASNAVSSAIAYDGVYREAIKAGLKPEDAHTMASQRVDEILHETSQPVFGVDRPIGEEGNPLQATIARFAGPVRQRFGIAVDSVKGAPAKIAAADTPLQKFGAIGDVSWKIAAAWVIPGLMEHAVKQAYLAIWGTNQQQEDANKLNEYIGAAIAGPVYGMYYAGPVAAAAIKAAITGEKAHLSTGNPLFDEANSLVGAVKRKMGNKSDKTPISDDITLAKVSMDTAAMLMGLVGLNHAATATASVSGALNPARVISKKLEDDGKVKKKK